ncbi:MAG: glycosyltransferase family 2 protein [Micrococcales bacterium]
MSDFKVANSPVGPRRYNRSKRLTFLFAALRTRSLIARDELANIATDGACDAELLYSVIGSALTVTNRRALLDLAWLLSNQPIFEHDLVNADRIYAHCLKAFGLSEFSHMHRTNYAMVALRMGDAPLAKRLLAKTRLILPIAERFFPQVLNSVRMQVLQEGTNSAFMFNRDYTISTEFLRIDADNPFRGLSMHDALEEASTPEAAAWLARLNAEVFGSRVAPISFIARPKGSPFDSLGVTDAAARPGASKMKGPKVTVVMSAFQPDEHIFAAVHSTLAQTYANIELLVIDDCSGEYYDDILEQVAAMDPRIRVLRQPENGGTYRIRNRAMDEAEGELITFQDSDDWMHPQRIELQVANLIYHPDAVGNISLSTRLTDRLEAVESGRRLRIGLCEPSLMFWREKVRDKIGYFDQVRKSGDSEFRKRMNKAFDVDCPVVHPFKILTVQRADNGGLTQGDLGFRWITEFRTHYRDSYLYWHSKIGKATNWNVPRFGGNQFWAPRGVTMLGADARATRSFDLVLACNLRDNDNVRATLLRLQQALAEGQSVGFLQLNNIYPRTLARSIGAPVMDLLNSGKADMVYPKDHIVAKRVEVLAPSAWLMSHDGTEFNWEVEDLAIVDLAETKEQFVPAGKTIAEDLRLSLRRSFGPDVVGGHIERVS